MEQLHDACLAYKCIGFTKYIHIQEEIMVCWLCGNGSEIVRRPLDVTLDVQGKLVVVSMFVNNRLHFYKFSLYHGLPRCFAFPFTEDSREISVECS